MRGVSHVVLTPRKLRLDYNCELPIGTILELEMHGKRDGLPLYQMELLGQTSETAAGYVSASNLGLQEAYLQAVLWERLENALYRRKG